ncbi:unnamed protein product [Bubo scandiacus]
MKLLALCGFLFVCLLCVDAFTAEGRKVKKVCCLNLSKLNKKVHKGINFKMTQMEIRKRCKPCPQRGHLMASGPLPQLK